MTDTTTLTAPMSHEATTAPAATIAPAQFRALMSTFPTGVAVVTTGGPEGTPRGLTVSSVSSVSLDPPTLLVCLNRSSRTLESVLERRTFAVNLLHAGARSAATLFASGDPDRFDAVEWANSAEFGGPHLVRDAHAVADCRVSRTLRVGDHEVIFGEIFRVQQDRPEDADPLLYGMRTFASWPAAAA
ncbi:flavin reductase family protein [Streptomyces sp. NPDC001793]|uniref:flavin reductase family protein n=1 Tax=Streptomyces sp. NPDC001793 TaxID=3154657 RepID=UPI0033307EE9